jgi:hypothetical protein
LPSRSMVCIFPSRVPVRPLPASSRWWRIVAHKDRRALAIEIKATTNYHTASPPCISNRRAFDCVIRSDVRSRRQSLRASGMTGLRTSDSPLFPGAATHHLCHDPVVAVPMLTPFIGVFRVPVICHKDTLPLLLLNEQSWEGNTIGSLGGERGRKEPEGFH